jgi:glycosyltransferase involved in cell wall biosynthesis
MHYSVIIPSYNSQATIRACLDAITHQRFDEPYEVIVVDSSIDGTPEIIRQHFSQVTLIHRDQRTDSYTARNIGIDRARGVILCFLDSDCIAHPDWLRRIAEAHTGNYAAVGGSVANGNPQCLIGWAGYLAEFREFFPFHQKQLMFNIPTCNISYKRWVFKRYGKFQDLHPDWITVKHPQQGDLIFNLNLYKQNEAILFDPAIQVAHINMTSIRRFLIHQYRLGRVTSLVLKHFPCLKGGTIANSRILTLCVAPFLPLVKFVNTFRVAAQSKEYASHFLLIAPVLFWGLLVWGIGFIRGAFLPKRF